MLTAMIFFPLGGFLINGIWSLLAARKGRSVPAAGAGWVATGAMSAAFVAAVLAKAQFSGGHEEILFEWFRVGALGVDFKLRWDALSSVFALVITGVGTLIHLYSIAYMGHDEGAGRYFAYLNLFCFMMLNLVLGGTLPHVFLGWEGVGLASYLLIGFWFGEKANVGAGQKAFVMNRVGDLGFLVAMFLAYKFAGTLDLAALEKAAFPAAGATAFGLLIFLACTGKSAQLPLFTWLPDAMAGPTPVSALIHAATMVTSGIYLLARMGPVLAQSPTAMAWVAAVGGVTALLTAVIACFQNDIKKILAYSTVSQLGFMFVACGVGASGAGVFHVMTHAFFKALLFLGAGSVIHALQGEQDIFKMGGLRTKMPLTFWTFTAGWAALLGLPPMSGFFSKDEILHQAWVSHHGSPWVTGLLFVSAVLTAFYMTRLYILVFFGKSRVAPSLASKVHESPAVMTLPLVLLAVLSLVGGWWGEPVHSPGHEAGASVPVWVVMVLSVLAASMGAGIAYRKYRSAPATQERVSDVFGIDGFYAAFFGRGLERIAGGCSRWIEEGIIQGILRAVGAVVDLSGNMIRMVQVGSAQAYLLMMVLALVAFMVWFLRGGILSGNI